MAKKEGDSAMNLRDRFIIAITFFCLITSLAQADIIGRASVIDGDTIEIHGIRFR